MFSKLLQERRRRRDLIVDLCKTLIKLGFDQEMIINTFDDIDAIDHLHNTYMPSYEGIVLED